MIIDGDPTATDPALQVDHVATSQEILDYVQGGAQAFEDMIRKQLQPAPIGDGIFDPGTQNAVNTAIGAYRQLVFRGLGSAESPESREAMTSQLIQFRGKLLEKPLDPRAKQHMIQQWNQIDEEFQLQQQETSRGADMELEQIQQFGAPKG
jgi:hypothetical protein